MSHEHPNILEYIVRQFPIGLHNWEADYENGFEQLDFVLGEGRISLACMYTVNPPDDILFWSFHEIEDTLMFQHFSNDGEESIDVDQINGGMSLEEHRDETGRITCLTIRQPGQPGDDLLLTRDPVCGLLLPEGQRAEPQESWLMLVGGVHRAWASRQRQKSRG